VKALLPQLEASIPSASQVSILSDRTQTIRASVNDVQFTLLLTVALVVDKVHAKHPDMVLLKGGTPKRADRIAACWADNRNVRHVGFKPDGARHAKAAPVKRNDQMLDLLQSAP
jgi:SLOG family YspA-like protein/AcrB/AcrD/AcrF family protein